MAPSLLWIALFLLVVISPLYAFAVSILSRLNICSSTALLLRVVSIGFSLCCFYLLHLPSLFCFGMFFLDLALTSCGSSRVFLFICCMCLNFLSGTRETISFSICKAWGIVIISWSQIPFAFYLPVFFKRFVSARRKRYFIRQWGGNGVVCSLRGSDLVFHL